MLGLRLNLIRSWGDLTTKDEARRDFHVVPEFQIAAKRHRLLDSSPAHRFEDHHSKRAPWKHVTEHYLCKDGEVKLLVGDGLDYAEGNDENHRKGGSESECPDREPHMTYFDADDA